MEILKLLMVINCVILSTSSTLPDADEKNENPPELDVINQTDDDDFAHRKRESGYAYSKPNSLIFKGPKPFQPFNRYGPPIRTSSSKKPSSQISHSWHQNHQPDRYSSLRTPSPIRDFDFKGPNPIATQNNEPFQPNFANYLPPKNQKLPGYSSPVFEHHHQQREEPKNQQFTENIQNPNDHSTQLSHPTNGNPQISDGAFFLLQNAEALSQLYSRPAENLNYPPFDDVQPSNNPSQGSPRTVEKFDAASLEQPRHLVYTPTIFNSPSDVNKLQTEQTKAFITQLQQTLASFQTNNDIRYAQSYGDILHKPSIISSIPLQLHSPSAGEFGFHGGSGGNGGVEGNKKGERPGGAAPTFPSQIGSVFPFVIADASFGGVSNHVSNQASGEGSPTHFGLPLPTSPSNGPTEASSGSGPSTSRPNPTVVGASRPEQRPIQHFPVRPTHLAPAPVFPAVPVVPAVTQIQNPVPVYPTYGLQLTAINTVFVKPLKPVYPIYYYTNPYRLVKPLAANPWNYAPSYSQPKAGSIC